MKLLQDYPLIIPIGTSLLFLIIFLTLIVFTGSKTVDGSNYIGVETGPNKQLNFYIDKSPLTGICYEGAKRNRYTEAGSVTVIDCQLYESVVNGDR